MIHGKMRDKEDINKYTINVSKEELINCEIKDRVLAWCKQYHPEVFVIAKKKVIEDLNNNENN